MKSKSPSKSVDPTKDKPESSIKESDQTEASKDDVSPIDGKLSLLSDTKDDKENSTVQDQEEKSNEDLIAMLLKDLDPMLSKELSPILTKEEVQDDAEKPKNALISSKQGSLKGKSPKENKLDSEDKAKSPNQGEIEDQKESSIKDEKDTSQPVEKDGEKLPESDTRDQSQPAKEDEEKGNFLSFEIINYKLIFF